MAATTGIAYVDQHQGRKAGVLSTYAIWSGAEAKMFFSLLRLVFPVEGVASSLKQAFPTSVKRKEPKSQIIIKHKTRLRH